MSRGLLPLLILATMSLLYFLLMAGTFNSLGLVLPDMVKAFGMNWAEAGFGFTLLGTACGLVSLAPAWTIRRFGVAKTLVAGTVLLVAGFVLMFASAGVLSYDIAAVLLGLGFCFCGTVPGVHVLTSIFSRRSAVLGTYFTIGSMGAVAGPELYLLAHLAGLDWRQYWLCFAVGAAVLGMLAAAMSAAVPRHTRHDAAQVASDPVAPQVRRALRTGRYWVIVAAYTACLAINTTTHSFAFQHMVDRGMAPAVATQLISLAALFAAGGSALAGVLGERVGARALSMLALGGLGLSALTLAIGHGPVVLGIWVVSLGVGLGLSYVGTAVLLQDCFGPRASLELYSIMTAVSTSAAIGPAVGGAIRDHTGSFAGIFVPLAVIALAMLGALALVKTRKM